MRAALFTLGFLPWLAYAQNWCPTGATWQYENISFTYTGYFNRLYTGDTLYMGLPAKRIQTLGSYIYLPGTPGADTTYVNYVTYTAQVGDLVMVRGMEGGLTQWDTLMRFDAVPGDRWYPIDHEVYCDETSLSGMYQVVDTGHITMGGANLRFWTMGVLDWQGNEIYTLRYYERLGWLWGLVPHPAGCTTTEYGESLLCYADMDVDWDNPQVPGACDLSLAIEPRDESLLRASPNPGTDHFTLALPSGQHTITLFDATGRSVSRQRNGGGPTSMDARHLSIGLYTVLVTDDQGRAQRMKWLKE